MLAPAGTRSSREPSGAGIRPELNFCNALRRRIQGFEVLLTGPLRRSGQFRPANQNIRRSRETEADLVSPDCQYGKADVVADDNLFIHPATQNQHGAHSCPASTWNYAPEPTEA